MRVGRKLIDAMARRSKAFHLWRADVNHDSFPENAFKEELEIRRVHTFHDEIIGLAPNAMLTISCIFIGMFGLITNDELITVFFLSHYIVVTFQTVSSSFVNLTKFDRYMEELRITKIEVQ